MPTIEESLHTCSDFLDWGHALANVPAQRWLAPMRPGNWSIAECLAHLIAWDRYMITERLPRITSGARLPSAPDVQELNSSAAAYARSGITQIELVEEFIATRGALIDGMRRLMDHEGDPTFSINGNPIALSHYLHGMIEHDQHHQQDIDGFLSQ